MYDVYGVVAMNTLINTIVILIFLFYPYTWVDGTIARFMY